MRTMMIAGNWKMNGSREQALALMSAVAANRDSVSCDMAIFPPSVYLILAQEQLTGSGLAWGAQNVSRYLGGAYTGEVSPGMLCDMGCTYVLVGHSERRQLYHESNAIIAAKFASSLNAGLRPILCVGETLEQRQSGLTLEIVQEQLAVALALHDNPLALNTALIAYEPVWAIGTGQAATPEQVQAVHEVIRAQLAEHDTQLASEMRILYGGSVTPNNAAALFQMADIDGALVGGASLNAQQFIEIGLACNN